MKELFIIRADGVRQAINPDLVQAIVRQNGKIVIILKNGQTLSLEADEQLIIENVETGAVVEAEGVDATLTDVASHADIERFTQLLAEEPAQSSLNYFQAAVGLLGVGAVVAAASNNEEGGDQIYYAKHTGTH